MDTNLWMSYLISGNKELDQLIIEGKLRLIFSHELLDEFLAVIQRPKFQKYFGAEQIRLLLSLFDQ